jgi:hypothetical protein
MIGAESILEPGEVKSRRLPVAELGFGACECVLGPVGIERVGVACDHQPRSDSREGLTYSTSGRVPLISCETFSISNTLGLRMGCSTSIDAT